MQTVVQNDTVPLWWGAVHDEPEDTDTYGQPVDLSGSTGIVHVRPEKGTVVTNFPAIIRDPPSGEFGHLYVGLEPGVYVGECEFTGPAGIATAPTRKTFLFRVRAELG
jgi:hypothetical protein